MITNFYTLFHLADELDRIFSGSKIDRIFTQHREELIISIQKINDVIIIGCPPSNNYLYAKKNFAQAHKNSMDLFKAVSGMTIDKISIHPEDRQIDIQLEGKYRLSVHMFGPKANVVLLDERLIINDIFLKKTGPVNTQLQPIAKEQITRPAGIPLQSILTAYPDIPLGKALKQVFPKFGPVIIRELLETTGLNGEQFASVLKENEINRLLEKAGQLTTELSSSPSPRIYFDGDSPVRFSIIPLHHLRGLQFTEFDLISDAIQRFKTAVYHEKTAIKEREEILKLLKHEKEKTEKTKEKIAVESEISDPSVQYENYGKLITANIHLINKGDKTACVEDFIKGGGDLIDIPLDTHLSPAKNAERYFEKAKKTHHAAEERRQRLLELVGRQEAVDRLLEQFEEAVTADDLLRFIENNQKQLSQFGLKVEKSGQLKKEERVPFRVFVVTGGFQVWAGKSSENNDLLTTRHTAKNDLWFHSRGVGGSHVVLKVGTGKGEVSRQAIEQAAGIAAYYSKMKKSKLVPVTMCEGKYVRKPKGVPAGTVTVEREKTIYAVPALPQSL